MKELDPTVLAWVLAEFLGPWLWPLLALALVWAILLIAALRRPGRVLARRLWTVGALAALVAAVVLPMLTDSGWSRFNGSADWIALAVMAVAAGCAVVLAIYPLCRLAAARRSI